MFKTRRNKLKDKILLELNGGKDIENILIYVDEYEKDNLNTIEYLRKEKTITTNRIKGGLKQTIHSHGPITTILIGSAVKRIYGSLIDGNKKQNNFRKLINKIRVICKF